VPSNVAAASPVGVLPAGAAAAFSRTREFAANINTYRGGEAQVGTLVLNERNRWQMTRRLAATEMETLRQFYLDHNGGHIAFWFYDQEEGPVDPTGVATLGRYPARFDGPFALAFGIGRSTVPLAIAEVQ
jgi:hypothetical protein